VGIYKAPFFLLGRVACPPSLSSIVDLQNLPYLSIPPILLESFRGKSERRSRSIYFHQSISSLSEGNILDLDLEVLCGFPTCSSSFISPIDFVTLVKFKRGGFEHISGILAIEFGALV
jgi:hypothetical protein